MQRIKSFKTLSRAAAAALFLSVQAVICIGTVYWVTAETLGLGSIPALILGGVFLVPSLYLLMIVSRMCYEAETDPANQ